TDGGLLDPTTIGDGCNLLATWGANAFAPMLGQELGAIVAACASGQRGGGGDPALPTSPAAGTGVGNLKNYKKALKSLKKFGAKDPDCLTDLTAVGLTPTGVRKLAGANFTSYLNATAAQVGNAVANGDDLLAD